jgi:hypothetical protein
MVLDLLTLTAIPTVVGASEAVHQQRVLDEDAESEERQTPFYLDVFCDAQSRKRDEVHGAIVVLKDGKVRDHSATSFDQTANRCMYSSTCGPKIPKRNSRRNIRTVALHHTPSPASTSLSQPKTSLTDPSPHLQSSDSSARYPPSRRTQNKDIGSQS